jgi:hypothetical protein
MFRGGIYAILAVIALAFALAAIGTDIAQWGSHNPTGPTADMKLTPWQMCGSSGNSGTSCVPPSDIDCQPFADRMRAVEAFYVLTAIFLLIAIIFAVLDHGNVHGFRHYRGILLGLAFLIIACSLIGWAIALSLVMQSFCDGTAGSGSGSRNSAGGQGGSISSAPRFEWWASPFLMVVATFFGIIMFVVAHRAPALATAK